MNQAEINRILDGFNKEEKQAFDLRRQGLSVEESSLKMHVSESTFLNTYNSKILHDFGVHNWKELNSLLDNKSPAIKINRVWIILIIGLATVLFSGWVIGSRFPWYAVQIPTPIPTSTATPTPHLEDTVVAMVHATIIAMQPTPTEVLLTPVSTMLVANTGAGEVFTPTVTEIPGTELPYSAAANTGAADQLLWPWILMFFIGMGILLVTIWRLIRKRKGGDGGS